MSSALETFTQAVASLHAAGNLVDELSSTVVLADMWLAAGRPGKARRLYQRALQLAEAHGEPVARATADLHVGLSEIDLEAGDLDSARRHLETAAALGERASMTESRYRWFVAMGLLAAGRGRPDEAVTLLDQAEQLYRPGFFPDVRPIPAMKARVWIAQGNLARGRRLGPGTRRVRHRRRQLPARVRPPHLGAAAARAAPGATRTPARSTRRSVCWTGCSTPPRRSGRAGSLLEIRMLQALAHDAQGHRPQALEALADACGAGARTRGVRAALPGRGRTHGRAAERRRAAGRSPVTTRASPAQPRRIRREPEPPTRGSVRLASLAEPLSERELQVLRLLDSELSGPEIARELFISHNTLRTHTKHIFTKLGVTSRRAAVRRARERGLL